MGKASKIAIQTTAGDLTRNKIEEKITKAATKSSHEAQKKVPQIPQPTSIPKEIYISPEKRQHIINELL